MKYKSEYKSRLDKKFDILLKQEASGIVRQDNRSRSVRKMMNNKLAMAGLIFVTIVILASVFAPLICRYDPLKIDLKNILQPPSRDHIIGTDKIGRDIF